MNETPRRSTLRQRAPGRRKSESAASASDRVAPRRSATAKARQALETLCAPGRTPSSAAAIHAWHGSTTMSSARQSSRSFPSRTFSDETTAKSFTRAKSVPFSAAMPSCEPKNSRCAVPTFVISPPSGSAISQSRAISPGWFVPISTTRKSASSGQFRIVSGSPR